MFRKYFNENILLKFNNVIFRQMGILNGIIFKDYSVLNKKIAKESVINPGFKNIKNDMSPLDKQLYYEPKFNPDYVNNFDPDKYSEALKSSDKLIKRTLEAEEKVLSFKEFNFISEIYTVLDSMKFFAPTSIQTAGIPRIMQKKNIIYTSQTGTGKTLTYILPILHELKSLEKAAGVQLTEPKRPKVLILVPSRELAQQVEEVLKLFTYDVKLVVESLFVGKKFSFERNSNKAGVDIVVSTPERFQNHWDKENIYISKLSHLVVDELDTLLDSGYAEFIEKLTNQMLKYDKQDKENGLKGNTRQVIYASATITKSIDSFTNKLFTNTELVSKHSEMLKIIDKSTNHNLSTVKHEFLHVTDYDKYPTLIKILQENIRIIKQNLSIIIFCNSVMCARKTELFLRENNFSTACLHGDIPPFRRRDELNKFKRRHAKVLICTDLIARGLDFPFVFLVVNFDFPCTISDYLHRAGRTGRAGTKGLVVSFYRNFNLFLIEKIKKAQNLNLPLDVENSMYNLRKMQGNDKEKGTGYKKKIISEKKDTTPEGHIIRIRKRKILMEKFMIKSENDRNSLTRKILAHNQRKNRNMRKKVNDGFKKKY